MVKWFNDEETEEPLKSMVEDVPKFVAEYAIKNNLTKEKGWQFAQLKHYYREHDRKRCTHVSDSDLDTVNHDSQVSRGRMIYNRKCKKSSRLK